MSRSPLEPFVLEDGFAILDGGLATELETQAMQKYRMQHAHSSEQAL